MASAETVAAGPQTITVRLVPDPAARKVLATVIEPLLNVTAVAMRVSDEMNLIDCGQVDSPCPRSRARRR